jgi:GntR family transcriptional regulator/MocR family aminotransferase
MDIDYLEQALQNTKIKAVYVIPHHHCPTTVTMSLERRQKLLRLAKEYSFAIIEDDYHFEFHYEDTLYLPLASMDHNHNVIYIGSFSKTLAPAIRIGYLTGPEKFINAAATLRKLMDRQGDTLMEEALASLFHNGEIERHFRKAIKIYRERRNIFTNILATEFNDSIEFTTPSGGLAVWSSFEKGIDMIKVSELASKKGLYIGNGSSYKNESFTTNGLRLGFASLEVNEMAQAFDILKKSITY